MNDPHVSVGIAYVTKNNDPVQPGSVTPMVRLAISTSYNTTDSSTTIDTSSARAVAKLLNSMADSIDGVK